MPASLEMVRIALQAYGNGDCEIALALADPLIRWDERPSRPDGDLVWGHDDVERAMRRYLDSWEQYRFDLEDIAEVGPGKVVGICRERGRPKEGVAVDRRFGGLWVVEESKIVSWATYLTPKEAVRAAKELLGGRLDLAQIKRSTGPQAVRRPAAAASRSRRRPLSLGGSRPPPPGAAVDPAPGESSRARARVRLAAGAQAGGPCARQAP